MVQKVGYNCSNSFMVIFQKYSETQIYEIYCNSALTSLNSMRKSINVYNEMSFPNVVHFIATISYVI